MTKLPWKEYMMGFAQHAALGSRDPTQVGAALFGPRKELILTGFNGPPIGVHDKPERLERPEKYFFASHAEQNVIAFAARRGIRTEGTMLFVTHCPCSGCAKSIIQAGIKQVIFGDLTTSMPDAEFAAARIMFDEANVSLGMMRIKK